MASVSDFAVVVPTRNSARTLRSCLEAVKHQSVKCECIVVDNCSSDETGVIATDLADVVVTKGPERSAQRNAGYLLSSAPIVAFIDSDMELEPEVLEQAGKAIEAGAVGVVIPEYTAGIGFWAAVRAFERSFYFGSDEVEAARVFPRAVLDSVGGFDESMPPGPEDWDLTRRVREYGEVVRIESQVRHDEGLVTYVDACRKKAYYASGLLYFNRKYGGRQMVGALSRPYVRRPWKLIWPHPLLGLGVLLLKAGEVFAVMYQLLKGASGRRLRDKARWGSS